MSGPRSIFRYHVRALDGVTLYVVYVEADADAAGLVLGGVTNTQAPTATSNRVLEAEIPMLSGRRGRKCRARAVQIEYTASSGPVVAGASAWVPVFRNATFASYVVGQTGTHRGVACVLLRKLDGSPTVRGKRRD